MSLELGDFVAGTIGYLEHQKLNNDARVSKPPSLVTRTGPFVCISASSSESTWIELTTKQSAGRRRRFELQPEWILNKYGLWLASRVFVNESVYSGRNEAFMEASQAEWEFSRGRPRLTTGGLYALYLKLGWMRPLDAPDANTLAI